MACTTAPRTLRFLSRRGGTVAWSCFQICIAHHDIPNTANTTKRAIILGLVQEKREPPHWRLSRSETTAGIRVTRPIGSIRLILLSHPESVIVDPWASRKKTKMKSPVIAPTGRLIQKHHLQLARSVRNPPSLYGTVS